MGPSFLRRCNGGLRGPLSVRTLLTSLSFMNLLPCQVWRHKVGGCPRHASRLDKKRADCSTQSGEVEIILTGAIYLMVYPCELLFSIRCMVLRSQTFQRGISFSPHFKHQGQVVDHYMSTLCRTKWVCMSGLECLGQAIRKLVFFFNLKPQLL